MITAVAARRALKSHQIFHEPELLVSGGRSDVFVGKDLAVKVTHRTWNEEGACTYLQYVLEYDRILRENGVVRPVIEWSGVVECDHGKYCVAVMEQLIRDVPSAFDEITEGSEKKALQAVTEIMDSIDCLVDPDTPDRLIAGIDGYHRNYLRPTPESHLVYTDIFPPMVHGYRSIEQNPDGSWPEGWQCTFYPMFTTSGCWLNAFNAASRYRFELRPRMKGVVFNLLGKHNLEPPISWTTDLSYNRGELDIFLRNFHPTQIHQLRDLALEHAEWTGKTRDQFEPVFKASHFEGLLTTKDIETLKDTFTGYVAS